MLVHILIGAAAMAGVLLLINFTQKREVAVNWWQWVLTGLGFIYVIFVLEVIYAFLAEGAGQGAFTMGAGLALIAAIWGVLLGRFVFARKAAA